MAQSPMMPSVSPTRRGERSGTGHWSRIPALIGLAVCLFAGLGGGTLPLRAAEEEAQPLPSPPTAPVKGLIPADENLRKGMVAIRTLVLKSHSLITHRRMPPADARKFAIDIKAEVKRILSAAMNRKSDVSIAITRLMTDIVEGAEAVAGQTATMTDMDGILRIDEALIDYPKRFDHPGWQPLHEGRQPRTP